MDYGLWIMDYGLWGVFELLRLGLVGFGFGFGFGLGLEVVMGICDREI